MADDNKKKQNTAETDELTLEEKINKIKSREITEAEKGMLTLPAFEAACEAGEEGNSGDKTDLQQVFQ